MKSLKNNKAVGHDEQGMALLVTIMTVSLLVAVTIQFHKTTWQQFVVANNFKVETQLGAIADSGVNIALTLLQNDGAENTSDSLVESWATLGQEPVENLFPSGSLQVQIVDLTGLLQINSLVQKKDETTGAAGSSNSESEIRQLFLNLLLSGAFPIEDETEARSILDAVVDWIDADDKESDLGAENSYYQSLAQPYSARNGPIQYIEELLLIKGITPELLFGSGEYKGLADYVTVYGNDGQVNINTAPLAVIKSFDSLISDELLEKFDTYRKSPEHKESLEKPNWYKEVDGWPGDIVLEAKLLTTTSSYFQIIATGTLDSLARRVEVVAERLKENEIKLFGRKME
ncbi:general secretion pathway protein GspK [Desulfopila sp. IMCC35006]|uniref:type II secretion system minor pseudopilin GspK n=1 Tax=Desulfopila sp. IMCC35006 TaxID=2569542 RepID=UPI0010AB584D|nr:type II secretion system minor pseudopilin GspK [Desulfopila sp. IMCC35006]TKB28298.1 general secretion pathway protein GspK [Desulfopila sp. IMCC35006]